MVFECFFFGRASCTSLRVCSLHPLFHPVVQCETGDRPPCPPHEPPARRPRRMLTGSTPVDLSIPQSDPRVTGATSQRHRGAQGPGNRFSSRFGQIYLFHAARTTTVTDSVTRRRDNIDPRQRSMLTSRTPAQETPRGQTDGQNGRIRGHTTVHFRVLVSRFNLFLW